MSPRGAVDYHLVLAGPISQAASSRGAFRPLLVDRVVLLESDALLTTGAKVGIATNVHKDVWTEAEIYPTPRPNLLALDDGAVARLAVLSRA